MNIIKLWLHVKGLLYKPDGSLFVLVSANKMERGANNGTLRYRHNDDVEQGMLLHV